MGMVVYRGYKNGNNLFLFIFMMYMNNNLLNETFSKHLNLLRSRLKLDEGDIDSPPMYSQLKKQNIEKMVEPVGKYARELLAKKSFYYELPEGRLQLVQNIKKHFGNFYHNLGVQDLTDRELLDVLNDILSDDEKWVTSKDSRLTGMTGGYTSRTRAMPPNPETFGEFPRGSRQSLEYPVEESNKNG